MIDISIIIVNYNAFDILRKALDSVRQYIMGVSYEIIVVDNASTQGDIITELNDYPEVTIIKNSKNMLFGPANNQGMRAATGKYILLMNNDILFLEDSITFLKKYLESRPEKIMINCRLLTAEMTPQGAVYCFPTFLHVLFESFFFYRLFKKSSFFNPYYQNFRLIREPVETDVTEGCFMLLRREDMLTLGGFDEDFIFYGEETDFCKRFQMKIGKVIFHPGTKVIHLGGQSTGKLNWFKFKNLAISKILIYKKWYSGPYYAAIIGAQWLGYLNRFLLNILAGLVTFNKNKLLKGWYFGKMIFVYPKGEYKPKI